MQLLWALLLLLPSVSAQALSTVTITATVGAGGNDTRISITNDLGPTSVYVAFGSSSVIFDITYTSENTTTLASLVALQPTSATILSDEISLTLEGSTSIAASDLGGSCKLETFTQSSPRPPCMPLTYTPSASAPATRSATNGASIVVTVPEATVVCVNGYCANPLFYALPPISPQSFSDIGQGIIYDGMQGLMWQRDLLPGEYPYDAQNDDNFPTINRAAQDCYALRAGGTESLRSELFLYCNILLICYDDWRLPTRSELHRWADHSVSPAQNETFFPATTTTKDEAYWTEIRSKVNDYTAVYFMVPGDDGSITYGPDVGYSKSQRVRCVRTVINKIPSIDRFAVSVGGSSALDHYTGLVWELSPADEVWQNAGGATPAIAACQALNVDGFTDWRLPNNKEMNSFMDESRAGPAWNTSIFPTFNGANDWWWCSNNNIGFGTSWWWAWSGSDGVSYVNVSPGRKRCVRGPDFNFVKCTVCPPPLAPSPPPPPPSKSKGGLSGGAKAGIAIGVLLAVALLAVGGYFAYKFWYKQEQKRASKRNNWKISV